MKHVRYNKRMKLHEKLTLSVIAVLMVGVITTGVALAVQSNNLAKSKPSTSSQAPVELDQTPESQVNATESVEVASNAQTQSEQQQATPVTVVSVQQLAIEGSGNTDCQLTYSDDTTFQWHWVTSSQTSGYCDNRLVGKLKSEVGNGWAEADTNWQLDNWNVQD